MDVLVVGAGAVGQVYGHHLAAGGANVTFLVREKHAATVGAGFTLYPLNGARGRSVRLEHPGVVTRPQDAVQRRWDQVWLCVPSTALHGELLDVLCAGLQDATLVALTPGLEDPALLGRSHPEQRTVGGMISMLAYQTPLPGEPPRADGPGVAFWFPPLSPSPFDGPADRVLAVVQALRAGGCPAAASSNVPLTSALGSAVLISHVAALECAGWSVAALRTDRSLLALAHTASEQSARVAAAYHRARVPFVLGLATPAVMRFGLGLAPRLAPFPFEKYFHFHFSKVAAQTRQMLSTTIAQGHASDLAVDAVEQLLARLPPLAP